MRVGDDDGGAGGGGSGGSGGGSGEGTSTDDGDDGDREILVIGSDTIEYTGVPAVDTTWSDIQVGVTKTALRRGIAPATASRVPRATPTSRRGGCVARILCGSDFFLGSIEWSRSKSISWARNNKNSYDENIYESRD